MPISAMGLQNNKSVQVEQKTAPPPDTTTQPDSSETQSSPAVVIDISEDTTTSSSTASPLRVEPPKTVDEAADISASRAQAERVREAYLRDSLISQIGTVSEAKVSVKPLEKDLSERAINTYNSGKAISNATDETARVAVSA